MFLSVRVTTMGCDYKYDALISYRRRACDQEFARNLVRQLESAGLQVAIDERDFDPAESFLREMERCIKESRFTLIVASPEYFESGNCEEEAILSRVLDMDERRRRTIPLTIKKVKMPGFLHNIVGIDFCEPNPIVDPVRKLIRKLKNPDGAPLLSGSRPPEQQSAETNAFSYAKEVCSSDRTIPHNLPPPPCGFVGRAKLRALVRSEICKGGVIILKGQGGAGKTQVALAAVHEAYRAKETPGGIVWINGEVKLDLEACLRQMAQVFFGNRLEQHDITHCGARVEEHLQSCGPLVVFDYFDGLLNDQEVMRWVNNLRPPARVIVITRKVPPALRGHVIPVELPSRAESVQMFIQNVRERGGDTRLNEEIVSRLCHAVGDLPLAVQLLSARALVMSPKRLLERVHSSLDEIAEFADDLRLPLRHRSARACFELSFEGLGRDAKDLLLRVSVLPDSAGEELVTAVMESGEWEKAARELVDASMWRLESDRYFVQSLIRQFAQEVLNRQSSSRAQTEILAARAMARIARSKALFAQPSVPIDQMLETLEWFSAERCNLMACACFAESAQDWTTLCEICDATRDFWLVRGFWTDAEQLYTKALNACRRSNELQAEARFLSYLGRIYRHQGRWKNAESAFVTSRNLAHEAGDPLIEGRALFGLATIYQFHRQLDAAERACKRGVNILRKCGDKLGEARARLRLGVIFRHQNRLSQAREQYEKSLTLCRTIGARIDEGSNLNNIARIDLIEGRWGEAETLLLEDLKICRQYQYRDGEGNALKNLACLYRAMNRLDEAETVAYESLAIRRELGDPVGQGETLLILSVLRASQGRKDVAISCVQQAMLVLSSTEDTERQAECRRYLSMWQ